ncbi:MAG: hypothetical protein NTY71_05295 [Methanoregula sp.]|nr:hypothetical protein [Methanoregula sp.]
MTEDFCTRTARKIRRLGRPEKTARRFAGFFYVSMLSVCCLMGDAPCPEGQGEEGPERSFALPSVQVIPGTGSGIFCADARAASLLSADFRQRR